MMNWFKIKRYVAFLLISAFPLMAFFFTLLKVGDLMIAAAAWLATTVLMMLIGSWIIRHPMLQMVEGAGILALTIDSTGLIEPFIVKVLPPLMKAKLRNQEIEDVWDRNAAFYIKHPKPATLTVAEGDDGELYEVIVLGKAGEDHNDKFFSFEGHLTFIFNKALGTFITKDMLANLESNTMAKHVILYLSKKIEELSRMIRDFARYIVEQTKPKRFFGLGNWFIILIVVAVLLLLILMLPAFMDVYSSAGSLIEVPAPVVPRT